MGNEKEILEKREEDTDSKNLKNNHDDDDDKRKNDGDEKGEEGFKSLDQGLREDGVNEKFIDTTDIGAHETEKTHRLEKLLAHRPDKNELVEKNVLKTAANLDPSLQAKQLELEKNRLEDKLNSDISHRPQPEELVKAGILTEEETNDLKKS